VEIKQNALGQWQVSITGGKQPQQIASALDVKQAFSKAETWLNTNRPNDVALFNRNSSWRQDRPTEAQRTHAMRLGVPKNIVDTAKTKGDLSNLIALAESRRPPRPKAKFTL
jgi:hypothetical protein